MNIVLDRQNAVTKLSYIDTQEELEAFVLRAKGSPVLAIDTEFLREKTYYPNLCLLQLATEDEVAIVDPFGVEDLAVLAPLLTDESTVKLFHAGYQDLLILYREVGCLPCPVFDVQNAAALLGQSHQAGLATLLSAFLGVSIKKSDSFTDWTQRPLADTQMEYAADDVIYLPRLYREMKRLLEENKRIHWLDEEFAEMSDPERYIEKPYERYRHLKRGNQLSRRQMAAAREVAAWREREAMARDIPRRWVLTDEQVVEACKREAKTIDDLFMVRGVKQTLSMRDARKVVELMRRALASDESTWPRQETPQSCEPNVDSAVDLMEALMRVRAKEEGIAMQTLGCHGDLALVARGHLDETPLMRGWRRKTIGNDLMRLLAGEITLGLNGNELVVIES